jgi:hypothetical protein
MRERMRLRHFSERTIEAYLMWMRRYVRYHGRRHPRDLGEPEVTSFLTHLATVRCVAASTQNQALGALLLRMSTWSGTRSSYATARVDATGSRCLRAPSMRSCERNGDLSRIFTGAR